jgi:hypothetical protein
VIDRTLSFILRHGELATDVASKASYSFLGGSPITIYGGLVSGYLGASAKAIEASFRGVAWHSLCEDDAKEDLSSFIISPAIVTIQAEDSEYADNGEKPWYPGLTYAVDDLLRPTVSTGTPAYAVWTNAVYSNEISNSMYIYAAMIIALTGTGANPTSLTLLVTPCTKIK